MRIEKLNGIEKSPTLTIEVGTIPEGVTIEEAPNHDDWLVLHDGDYVGGFGYDRDGKLMTFGPDGMDDFVGYATCGSDALYKVVEANGFFGVQS